MHSELIPEAPELPGGIMIVRPPCALAPPALFPPLVFDVPPLVNEPPEPPPPTLGWAPLQANANKSVRHTQNGSAKG